MLFDTIQIPKKVEPRIIQWAKDHFKPDATVEGLEGVGPVYIGKDLRLYRKADGLLSLIAPCEPVKDSTPGLWIDKVHWEDFPPLSQVKYLYRTFFSNYKREVMVLIGKKWDESGWFFMVPEQVGTLGGIEWDDKKGTEWFLGMGRYIGTIHVHPGTYADPSPTDYTWWSKRDASGLHMILGREGAYTISGSCAGHTIVLTKGDISAIQEEKAHLIASLNRKLKKLLKVPPPLPKIKWFDEKRWGGSHKSTIETKWSDQKKWTPTSETHIEGIIYDAVDEVGGLVTDDGDGLGGDLRVLTIGGGQVAVVTTKQLIELAMILREWEVPMPPSVPLNRYRAPIVEV